MEIDLTRVLCSLSELRATGCREFRLGGGEWPLRGFLVKVGADVHGYVNRCAHQSLPLNYLPDRFLTYDDSMILCTAHGAIFEKSTGFCVSGPCAGRSLVRVAVRVVDDFVVLEDSVDVSALAARYS